MRIGAETNGDNAGQDAVCVWHGRTSHFARSPFFPIALRSSPTPPISYSRSPHAASPAIFSSTIASSRLRASPISRNIECQARTRTMPSPWSRTFWSPTPRCPTRSKGTLLAPLIKTGSHDVQPENTLPFVLGHSIEVPKRNKESSACATDQNVDAAEVLCQTEKETMKKNASSGLIALTLAFLTKLTCALR